MRVSEGDDSTPSDDNGDERAVFLSYSRSDEALARPVIDALEAAGIKVWWDALLEGGVRFNEVTENALETAYAVIVLWSQTSIRSHWVCDEATRGRDRGCLVPVSLDGSEPPLGFRQFQCIDISNAHDDPRDPQMQRLVHSVAKLRDRGTCDQPFIPPPMPPARKRVHIDRRTAIGGGALALAGLGGMALWQGGFLGGGAKPSSLAVLPFDPIGGADGETGFAGGLASEIRSQLARNPLLQVAAETSSNSFRETDKDAPSIAKALGVAFLLDGNVRQSEDRIAVNAELIDGKTGFAVLPLAYDQPIASIFELQAAIASAVAQELAAQMDDTDAGGQPGGTQSVAAYDAYLRGRELYDAGIDEKSDREALAKFDEALRIDPEYAAAHAWRGRTLALIGNLYTAPAQLEAVYGTAVEAARRAIAIAPDYPEGHAVLGFVLAMSTLDMKSAREPYDRAIELGRGDAEILSRYAIFRSRIGDFASARQAIESAAALDPLNARVFRFTGDIEYAAGEYARAIAAFERAKSIQESLSSYHYLVGLARLELGDLAGAKADFEAESRLVWRKTGGAIVEHRLGNRDTARAHLEELQDDAGDKSHYQYMQIFSQWGERTRALEALAKAWEKRDAGLVQLYNDPLLAPLRDAPEYKRLIARIGFV